jgi:FkbM family methyltransferase
VTAQLAQPDDEQFIRDFFAEIGGDFFVEVGVGHPTQGSLTWPLEQAGWHGVLVEPQPDLAAFLVTARSAKLFAVACSSPDRAGGTLPLHVTRPLTTFDIAAGAPPDSKTEYVLMVPVRTLDSILQEAEAPIPFDFLSLDVEGHELAALRGLDLAHWQPQLLTIRSAAGHLGTHLYLRRAGYRLVRSNGARDWYAPGELGPLVTMRERWYALRKFYLGWPWWLLRDAIRRRRCDKR